MGYKLIADNLSDSLTSLPNYESRYGEGDKGELRLFLSANVPDWTLSTLQNSLSFAGVELWDDVKQSNRTVYVRFRKAIAPLAIMAIIIAAAIAIVILLLGWQLFKIVKGSPLLGIPVAALAIGGGVLLAYLFLRRR